MKAPFTHLVTALLTGLLAGLMAIAITACGGGGGSSDTGSGGVADKPIAPSITTPPASQSVVAGKTATFSVVATGSATLAYQWKKNGADISGANTNTYTTPATSDADIGAVLAYSVVVSNTAGSATSTDAKLTVTAAPAAPVITTQPVNQSVVVGQTATFSVIATNSATSSYQWKKNGTDISGATSSTYTTPATAIGDSDAVFTVVVSNAADSVTSAEATLTVTATAVAPSITTQPAAQTVDPGKTASFSVEATGTSPLLYQWKLNGKDISDATSSSYTTPAAAMADSGAAYSVVVSNAAGTVTSSPASLTVTEAPVITTQPAKQAVNPGVTATFTVTATGTEPFSYQWRKNGENISGATDSNYTTPATSNGDPDAKFSVVVSNRAGTVTSSEAILSVNVPASIATQPANKSVLVGQTASFSVTAAGTGPFTYQWKKAGVNVTTGNGGTTSTYTTSATAIEDDGAVFTVVVSNSAGTPVTSSNATLTVTRYSLVSNVSGGFYDKTECVKDNSTGLVWEGKPASGTRVASNYYTNFDTTGTTQKTGSTLTQTDLNLGTNSVGYKNSVNTSALCGYTDWRMPTVDELVGILDRSQATTLYIDSTWFPNTDSAGNALTHYWTSVVGTNSTEARTVYFTYGGNVSTLRTLSKSVRLVRCGAVSPATCTSN